MAETTQRCAVILAGGKGTRLKPYTLVLPKPLMPIGEFPILEVVVRQLVRHGFTNIVMAVNHLAEIIQAFFGDGSKWGAHIRYSLEEEPLGTMGPLRLIGELPDDFLIMNGDVLTDMDFSGFFGIHLKEKCIFSICAHNRKEVIEYGVLDIDEGGRLVGFREKPTMSYCVSMGVYAANRRVLDFVPANQYYGFDTLMHDLMRAGERVQVLPLECQWMDIGRPDDYTRAIEEFDRNFGTFLPLDQTEA